VQSHPVHSQAVRDNKASSSSDVALSSDFDSKDEYCGQRSALISYLRSRAGYWSRYNFRSKTRIPEDNKMLQGKSLAHWAHRFATHGLLLAGTTTLLASLALVATANAGVTISINPPVCSYGYYDYAPYGCAPSGFYGPGYFYNGIFLGVGPWASWGYGHGWGDRRFNGGGGGRYVETAVDARMQPIADVGQGP
jgi:hypothetical protein